MAITYAPNVFTVSGACTEADLKAAIDANPTNGMYEAGACVFRDASLTWAASSSLTIRDGTNLVFDDSGAYRCNLVYGSTLDFKYGGGITYNGNVQHSFFNGALNGSNITYRMNANTVNGRGDFFTGATSTTGLSNINLVLGGGASGFSFYIHFQGLGAYPISNVKIINDIRVASGQLVIGMKGTYSNIVFPKSVSNYGISLNIGISLVDSAGKTTVINYPTFYGSSLSVINPVIANAELIDETWPDVTAGTVGSVIASYGSGTTTTKRKITWTPGTYVGWNVYLADNQSTPTVYQNGLLSSSTGIKLTWQSVVTVGTGSVTTTTTLSPFRLTARKLGYKEQYKLFSPVQPIVEAFIPEVDSYYTSDQSALTNIAANASTRVLTLSAGAALTLDQVNDWIDSFLISQLAAIPQTPKSNSGTVCTLTAWAVSIAIVIGAGAKLKTLAADAVTLESGADITGLGIISNVTQDTPTALTGVTITGNLTYNTNTPITVTLTGCTVTGTVSNTGTGTVTIKLINSSVGAAGSGVTLDSSIDTTITAPYLLAGTTVRLRDKTNNILLDEAVTTGAGYSFSKSWTENIELELRHSKIGYMVGVSNGIFASTGATFLDTQSVNKIYNSIAIDGSTCTEFLADYPSLQIDVSDGDGKTTFQRIYAWFCYVETSFDGLAYFAGGISAISEILFVVNVDVLDLKVDNVLDAPLLIDGGSMVRSDGTSIIAAAQTGRGGIQIDPISISPSAAANATAVRAELSAELARIDASITSRLAAAGYTAPTATDLTPVLTAVAAIGEPLQAVDYVAPTAAPTAAANAAAVRAELATEMGQVTKVAKLHGVGASLVVTATTRTAGDLAQTITSEGDTTTVSAV